MDIDMQEAPMFLFDLNLADDVGNGYAVINAVNGPNDMAINNAENGPGNQEVVQQPVLPIVEEELELIAAAKHEIPGLANELLSSSMILFCQSSRKGHRTSKTQLKKMKTLTLCSMTFMMLFKTIMLLALFYLKKKCCMIRKTYTWRSS